MNCMKRFLLLICFSFSLFLLFGKDDTNKKITAKFDERIELMSIICHLAGYPEYNMNLAGEYIDDIDRHFSEFKNHPVVSMMDSLRRSNGIGFDSPMFFALCLQKSGDNFTLFNDLILPERRWKDVDLIKAASEITDFYNQSDFSDFFERHKPFYNQVCAGFDENVIDRFNLGWFNRFYGIEPVDNFEIVIGFTNGGGNYGPSIEMPGRPRDIYAIIGYALNEDGRPYYSSDPEIYLNTVVHEFNHSFVNPLAENPKFKEQIEQAGNKMFEFAENAMGRMAYSTGKTLVNESLVRAAVILYLIEGDTPDEQVRHNIVMEMSSGFYWMPELVEVLKGYIQNRETYPSFETFYPVIIEFFNNYAKGLSDKVDTVVSH